MKTKLLKKVRKRFSIIRHDRIDNPKHYLYGHELPLYECLDDHSEFFSFASEDYEAVFNRMMLRIRAKYYYTKKNKRNIQEKVWYNDHS